MELSHPTTAVLDQATGLHQHVEIFYQVCGQSDPEDIFLATFYTQDGSTAMAEAEGKTIIEAILRLNNNLLSVLSHDI